MAYASYDYYPQEYLGTDITSANEFNRLAERASEYIDQATMNRARTYADTNDVLKKACCAVAEVAFIEESNVGKTSETVGKWSVSYEPQTDISKKKYDVLKRYLITTGLLYTGMGR